MFKAPTDKPSNYSFSAEINGEKIELIDKAEYNKVKAQLDAINAILNPKPKTVNNNELILFDLVNTGPLSYADTHNAYDPVAGIYTIVKTGDYIIRRPGIKSYEAFLYAGQKLSRVEYVRSK